MQDGALLPPELPSGPAGFLLHVLGAKLSFLMGKHSGESPGAPCAGFWGCSGQLSDCRTPAGQGIQVQAPLEVLLATAGGWQLTSWGLQPCLAPQRRGDARCRGGRSWLRASLALTARGFRALGTPQPSSGTARRWCHGCSRVSALLLRSSAASAPQRALSPAARGCCGGAGGPRGRLGVGQRQSALGSGPGRGLAKIATRCPLPQKRFVAG